MDTVVIQTILSVVGTAMIAVIAYLLKRFVEQFDRLVTHVDKMEVRLLRLEWLTGNRGRRGQLEIRTDGTNDDDGNENAEQ